jgi:hypothetical protein
LTPACRRSLQIIALEYGGAKMFARLLCDDPSCQLMAIILVNLTFADAELRKELVSVHSGISLVESLAFALRVASLTPEEYEARQTHIEDTTSQEIRSPSHRLSLLMAEDERLRSTGGNLSYRRGGEPMVEASRQLFPETARWCLSALKNLTRPCRDATAAHILIKSGIFSLILRFITISGTLFPDVPTTRNSGSHSTSSATPSPVDPLDDFMNAPSFWDSNSMQDAALFVVLNLSACSSSRDYVYEADAVNILSSITEFPSLKLDDKYERTDEHKSQQEFQCLKAVSRDGQQCRVWRRKTSS